MGGGLLPIANDFERKHYIGPDTLTLCNVQFSVTLLDFMKARQ